MLKWQASFHGFHTTRSQPKAKVGKGQWDGRTCCCKGNNYEQRFALDTFPANCSGIMSWHNVLAKPCILLFTLQQDCYTRIACRLLLVVKVVFVVFPNSAGRIGNSTNPITRFSGRTRSKREGERFRPPRAGSRAPGEPPRRRRSVAF